MISPAYLRKGDKVAIMCMAGKLSAESLTKGIAILESWGLEVVLGKSVGAEEGSLGGSDSIRGIDLQGFLNDGSIKAIFAGRGGYGSTRIIDHMVFKQFAKSPKWIVGFSDVTAIISHVNKLGFEAIHGPMIKMLGNEGGEYAVEMLRKTLFGEPVVYNHKTEIKNRPGTGKGKLTGGNLCILSTIIGTKSDISFDGKILFIEEIDEYRYAVDRMLVHLDRAGKLKHLEGLIVGHFTNCDESDNPFGKSIQEIVAERVGEYDFPVAYGFPVGHEAQNWPLICGRKAELLVEENEVWLNYC